jgi:L-cysteine/cystine lyase
MNLDAVRAELPVLRRLAYLNTGSFGPLPRRTFDAMAGQERVELEDGRSGSAYWKRMGELRDRAREAIGRVLNAPAGSVALTRSTTDGCNIAVASLRLSDKDEIVTTDDEHFGLLGALRASGARVRVAALGERPPEDAAATLAAELGRRTRLVALSHVTWTTGRVLPVREVAALCAERGIPLLVDGAQSAGAIDVDVGDLGCDFYTVSGQKWLLGPDGTGGLYVRPELVEDLAVTFVSGWGQDREHHGGAALAFAPGARRFYLGTLPAPALIGIL